MKKIKKISMSKVESAPVWFRPAMEKVIDMLEERATKDDLRKLTIRVDKTLATLSNHETRIIHLEGTLPSR